MNFDDPYDHNDPNLMYTPENIPTKETEEQFNEEFTVGCECKKLCNPANGCTCIGKSGGNYLQTKNEDKNVFKYVINITEIIKPIYECNKNCKCDATCGNRLVQFGPRKNLKIVSCEPSINREMNATSAKRLKLCQTVVEQHGKISKGLGLITTENIRKGNFICEYAGEIITAEEANKRYALNKEHNLMNYIFCVIEHFGVKNIKTYIDPSTFGNIGRYLNHSCQPNCKLTPVRVNSTIPKLCIFAAEDVERNCELTFDYGSDNLSEIDSTDEKKIACLCKTVSCRKFLPFNKC